METYPSIPSTRVKDCSIRRDKIKTRAWVERVKALYAGDEAKLKELL